MESTITKQELSKKAKMNDKKYKKEDVIAGFLFILPPILGFICFSLIPIIYSLIISFSEYDVMTHEITIVGTIKYMNVFSDKLFFTSLINISIALVGVIIQIIVMLVVAMLLTADVKGIVAFRALFFVPSLCSSVAITVVWKLLYAYDGGIINSLLTQLGLGKVGWLTDKNIAMISMVIQGIWMGIGGGMVMYISALKNVPTPYYEAAQIDGANGWQRFRNVTLPCISPTTFYILTTTVIGASSDFARYKLMTDGGPDNATLTPVLYIYKMIYNGFGTYPNDYAYATALSWVFGLGLMLLVGLIFLTSKKWVHYSD